MECIHEERVFKKKMCNGHYFCPVRCMKCGYAIRSIKKPVDWEKLEEYNEGWDRYFSERKAVAGRERYRRTYEFPNGTKCTVYSKQDYLTS